MSKQALMSEGPGLQLAKYRGPSDLSKNIIIIRETNVQVSAVNEPRYLFQLWLLLKLAGQSSQTATSGCLGVIHCTSTAQATYHIRCIIHPILTQVRCFLPAEAFCTGCKL